jgi:VCBS repeat-containing protein
MGYNISEVSGTFTGTPDPNNTNDIDNWTFAADLSSPAVTTVSGDFNVVAAFFGPEATGGYAFSPLSTTAWGTLAFNTVTGQFTFTIDRAAIIASGSDQSVTFTVTGTSGLFSDTDTVTINILICLARGTLVATPDGEVSVEDLRPGDLVLTADGRAEPVRWIGSRQLTSADLVADASLRPVRIAAGAFGPGRPARDLRVSPQHRVLLTGWHAELLFGEDSLLVPAKGLVDDHMVRIDTGDHDVEYFHVLLDRHEVLLTEGLPTESFFPGSFSLSELDRPARDELLRLFPGLAEAPVPFGPAVPGLRPWEARLLSRRPS